MKTEKRLHGDHAEALVADYLQQQGFTILERNYRKPYGEIDLIATTKELLVFVEVKMRSAQYFDLAQVITYSKQQKIITVAQEYLTRHSQQAHSCRFDVALVCIENGAPQITYVPNAFASNY